jgi:hypothetical protein
MGYVDDAFDNLKSWLEITDTEAKAASTRQRLIREHLDAFWDIDSDFLTGSYRRHTKTKPLADVDIFVVLASSGAQARFRDESPDLVLKDAARVLGEKWDDVTIDRMAAVVSYGDEVASFEVVPAFDREEGGYMIPDSLTGSWIETDPGVHDDQATAKNTACGGKWIPFVKMVKGANRELGSPVKPSFLLEVMAHEIVTEPFGRYQDEVSWFLATAAERLGEPWPDPARLGPDVNAEMSSADLRTARQALTAASDIAQHAVWLEDDGQDRAAVEEWRRLFGDRMPRP